MRIHVRDQHALSHAHAPILPPSSLAHDNAHMLSGAAQSLHATAHAPAPARAKVDSGSVLDPVLLSVFSNRFMSIAEQMGKTLQRTAISTNIKERLDFSCALFGVSKRCVKQNIFIYRNFFIA